MKYTIVLTIIFSLFAHIINAQVVRKGTWDYPMKPGSKEWSELESHQEMVNVCQIPVELLPTIPTEELAELCLNYPLFFTMEAFNNLQEGFNQVSTEFNGFQELFERVDAGVKLLEIYKNNNPESVQTKKDLISRGLYKQRIFFIEFILSQKIIFEKLSNNEKKSLLSETIIKIEEKTKAGFSTFNKQITSLIAVRVLQSESAPNKIKNTNNEKYKVFSNSVLLMEKEMIDEIKDATFIFLNDKI